MEIIQKTSFKNIPLEGVLGVLIDFDNTLYEYKPAHEKAMHTVHEAYRTIENISYEDFLDAYNEAKKEVKIFTKNQAASHSRFLYFQKLLEIRFGRTDIEKTILLEETYWSAFQKAMIVYPEAIDFLKICKEKYIKTCLITDLTSSVQFRKIRLIGIDPLLDFIVTSEEAGAEKPDPRIFSLALEKLRMYQNEVIMIGDDKLKDIDGAHNLKIKAYMV